jgi:photosystem II stability/assembly factor-like uncharacterized protein
MINRLLTVGCLSLLGFLAPRGADAQSSPSTWEPIGLSGGGGLFGPAMSPVDGRRMLVHCDMSGAYLSEDGGRSWRMIHHSELLGNTQCRPAFHPTRAQIVFSASGWNGREVMVSTDGGAHWTARGELPHGLRGEIAIDAEDPKRMLVGAGEKVYRSRDGGRTWRECTGVQGEAVGFHFDRTSSRSRRTCFAATRRGIWRSGDGGKTWIEVMQGLPSREIRSFSGGSKKRGRTRVVVLYCTVPSRLEGGQLVPGIYRSIDWGHRWRPVKGKGLNPDTKRIDRWAMGDIAHYPWVRTTDGKPERVYAWNSNTGVAQPHHATVYRSDDGGASWTAVFNPDPRWEPTNVDRYYVTAEDGQFYQGVPHGVAVNAGDPDQVFFVTSQGFITENGGKTWFPAHTRLARGQKIRRGRGHRRPGLAWVCNGLVVTTTWNYYRDPFKPKRHYICYTDLGFAISENRGRTWRWWREAGRAPWRNTCYELAFDPEIPGKVWGAFSSVHDIPNGNIILNRHRSTGPGGICVSRDFAESWTPVRDAGLPVAPATSIVVDPKRRKRSRTLYAGFFGHGVYRSEDDGQSWTPVNRGLGAEENRRVTRVQLHEDGTLFALVTARRVDGEFRPEGVGLYRSGDRGESWRCLTTGQPFLWPKDFTVDPKSSRVIYLGNADAGRERTGGLYRTTDGGRTWKRLAREGREHFGAYLHPRRKGWIYMTLTEGAPGAGLWLSRDGGRSFKPITALPFRNIQRVFFLPDEPDRMYVTTFGGSVWRGPLN